LTVLYDANVLYPNTLRDLLTRIAQSGTAQAKWAIVILDEMTEGLKLPDPDDRHVLAVAIKGGAQVIVTRNLKDFPESDTDSRNDPPEAIDDALTQLERDGLVESVAALRAA
jgi:hypothetical protein